MMDITFDVSAVGMLDTTPDAPLETIADDLRQRYGVDAALVTFIDHDRDRQVFKGISAPQQPWHDARSTPLSHSICKHVAATAAPFVTSDARNDTRLTDNLAPSELGVVGYLGVPIFAPGREAVGALCVITTSPRIWSQQEIDDLLRFAQTVDCVIDSRLGTHDLLRAETELRRQTAAAALSQSLLDAAAQNLPGAIFRYALFDDGSEAVEYASPSCADVWGYTEEELKGDPALLWKTILPEDLETARRSVMRSARDMSNWQCDFRIRNGKGKQRHLRGYGTPQPIPEGIGVVWNSLVLDLDKLHETLPTDARPDTVPPDAVVPDAPAPRHRAARLR